MASTRVGWFLSASALVFAPAADLRAGDSLAVRVVRPEQQGRELLGLFRGARAADPAAALAAWKNANGGKVTLGKPREAAIAALNPGMIGELKSLDGAEVLFDFEPGPARVRWRAVVPNDDGTFGALGTALALTDGAREEPLDGVEVFRLGPPGAPLSAGLGQGFALASTRDGLRRALGRRERGAFVDETRPGWHARLDPAGLRGLATVAGRRLSEALDAAGCREVRGWLALDGETLTLRVTSSLERGPLRKTAVDPAWLDSVPARGTLAAVSVAVDPGPESLDAAFALLDRVERADPARAGVAPLRTRLNLLAAAARVTPEADLWTRLKGFTAALLVDDDSRPVGAIVVLHAVDPAAAGRLFGVVLPRLASTFARAKDPAANGPDGVRALGTVEGKPLRASVRDADVVIGWGAGSLEAASDARGRADRSAGVSLRAGWGDSPPRRFGAFWPGRSRTLVAPGSPLAVALAGSPPVVWEGRGRERSAVDVVSWTGLRGVVRRWLDLLPLEPPADR